MKKESRWSMNKSEWRKLLLKKRAEIPHARRHEAAENLMADLPSRLPEGYILSFASLPAEINLWELNHRLAEERRLVLPKRKGSDLEAYLVEDLKDHLNLFYGSLLEPTHHCPVIALTEIPCILVPGLGFDTHLFRLGYGQGHYDRLLQKAKGVKIGVGFKEQLIEETLLPCEPHDQKVDILALF
jgi:5-formyltetrahydrofolate cyclo-ligase